MNVRRNKYNNIKTMVGNQRFASKAEAKFWPYLLSCEQRGEISDLKRQVKFKFPINGHNLKYVKSGREVFYKADFTYMKNGEYIVADVKGFVTPEYMLKEALMLACHGITVLRLK